MPYVVNIEKFSDGPSLVDAYRIPKESPMPKINLKLRNADLRIIDSVAALSGTPRSQVLVAMVEEIIRAMLRSIKTSNLDCAALIACYADQLAGRSSMGDDSWASFVFDGDVDALDHYLGNELPQRPRDAFREKTLLVRDRIQRAMK